MITNRTVAKNGLGAARSDDLSFFTAADDNLENFSAWKPRTRDEFRDALAGAAQEFPLIEDAEHERQRHVTLFVHGYNNGWKDAVRRYQQICRDMYRGPDPLGICVLFTWPSDGKSTRYLADREDARDSGPALARVFHALYEHALRMQERAASGKSACRAKVSVIAHSMGNWVLQHALQCAWERANKPLLVSLINQCLMVAADVDNDVFASGETIGNTNAEGMANLCYRITALYSGRDSVLGVSAGLKHFGKRRLGRSGLDRTHPCPDNVWDLDCSTLFPPDEGDIHGAYFWTPATQTLMTSILRGRDRTVITRGLGQAGTPTT